MHTTALTRILLISLLVSFASHALSCTCVRINFDQKFCLSGVAVRAKVIAQTDNCPGKCDALEDQDQGEITYIAKVRATFRGKQPQDKIMILKTRVNSAACGVRLTVGVTYLFVLGRGNNTVCPGTTFSVGLCDDAIPWEDVSKADKRFVLRNAKSEQRLCEAFPPPS